VFTKGLSRFVCGTNYDDLPVEVVMAAKLAILDFVGVAMAGSQEPSARIVSNMVRQDQSLAEASVIGHEFKSSPSLAALANGTAGHALDYDDCLDFPDVGLGHPTTGILPAALALGEQHHTSGRDLIAAYCVGLEAYSKVGLLSRDAFHSGRGWEWTGVLGVMGAVAAAAKIIKLDEGRTEMAFGIAASLACGLTRNFGTMAGHFHAGNAARNGIEAGVLAGEGINAYEGMIETPAGYYSLFTGNPDPVPDDVVLENLTALGNPWNIISPGLMFKAFPCAHISHFGVDAARQLRQEYSVDWRNIEKIEFRIPPFIQRAVWYRDPQTGTQGKFSLGYCLCRALVEGRIRISDFTDESIRDPGIRQLMDKITWVNVEQDPGQGPFGSQEIVLRMKNGAVYSRAVAHPRGEPQNPLTQAEFEAKFRDCALHAHYDEGVTSQIQDMVMNLEETEDTALLARLLGK
jgi:2-methylcitrate dehydratase PrpD